MQSLWYCTISTISYHLNQFLVLTYYSFTSSTRWEILQKNFKIFRKKNFLSELKKMNWESLFSQHKQDVNLFYKLFLDKMTFAWPCFSYETKHQRKKIWKKCGWQKEFFNQLSKKAYITNSLEAKKQLVKKHSPKNSNITKNSLTN